MGASSIDISQYRSRIGTFAGKNHLNRKSSSSTDSSGKILSTNTLIESFIMLSYLLVLSNVTQHLLIMSGVESNPGPFSLGKKCLTIPCKFLKEFDYKIKFDLNTFSIHVSTQNSSKR